MNYQSLKNIFSKSITIFAVVFLFIPVVPINSFAQYKGAPVKKDRLLKALKSKQLQTGDIVSVINTNGVDFKMTEEVRQSLIAAGARPEIIRAVAENARLSSNVAPKSKGRALDYDDLLDQALITFKEQNKPKNSIRFLENAVRMRPKDPKAYQMLGFVHLYGLNNLAEAEKYMRLAIMRGGSAVFRVFHDDRGSFNERCSGSLYISPQRIRFESDNNIHTFETSTVNVDRVLLDRESSKTWKNHPIFKVFLKIGKSETRFRFAPINASIAESQMASRFISGSKMNRFAVAGNY